MLSEGLKHHAGVMPDLAPEDPKWYIRLPGKSYEGYEYPDLLVAQYKSIYSLNWYDAQRSLERHGLRMLTIRQFIDFISLLQSDTVYDGKGKKMESSTIKNILDRIVKKPTPKSDANEFGELLLNGYLKDKTGNPLKDNVNKTIAIGQDLLKQEVSFNDEWLDAYFRKYGNQVYLQINNKVSVDGGYRRIRHVNGDSQPLEPYIKKVCYFNISNCNSQGLPTKKRTFLKKRGFIFGPPPSVDSMKFSKTIGENISRVAVFGRLGRHIGLQCNQEPAQFSIQFRVRAVKEI